MKKLKLAIYLLTLVFALTGCKKDVHVKTISEIKQMNKSQKQKSQKNKKRVKKSENTKLTGTESSPVPEDETTDNEQENQTVTDKKVIVLDPGHSAVVATGTEPLGPGSSEQKAADASGTRGISSGVPEYELTLNISVQLKEVLEQRGYHKGGKIMYLEVSGVKKSYGEGGSYVQVLKGINTGVEKGQMCVIQGTSGSGKSTLLNCIGGLDTMDSGSIKVDGTEIFGMNSDQLADYRRDNLGFIFQFYNLVPNLTVRENIQVCEYLTYDPLPVDDLIETLGLTEHQNKFPSQLSGGQQQRCAIARALVKNPKLLLCDEPTGALDSKTSRDILVLLEEINAKYGTTMLIVTHNNSIKNMVHKVIFIKDGLISREYENEVRVPASELEDL